MSCRKRLKHKHNTAMGKTNRGVLKGWNDRINDSLCTKHNTDGGIGSRNTR